MTMTAVERGQLTDVIASQAVVSKEVEQMHESIKRIHTRIDEIGDSIDKVSDKVCGIARQNEDHENRLIGLQNVTASLAESVTQIDNSCRRLKHVSFGFIGLLIVMTVLVGLLGEEILPKALSWLWTLVGL